MSFLDDPETNPYAPPPLDDGRPFISQIDLQAIAGLNRGLRFALLLLALASIAVLFFFSIGLITAWFCISLIASFVLVLHSIGLIDRQCILLHDSLFFRIPAAFLMFVAFFNILFLAAHIYRSDVILRNAGFPPDWFGVDPKTIPTENETF